MVKPTYFLPRKFTISDNYYKALKEDYQKVISEPEEHIKERYGIDVSSFYGPYKIKNPFGKASGQLSTNAKQIKADIEGGLGFSVLKTVIAESPDQVSEMEAWKISAPRMVVEKITSKNGEEGYTVTWKGRGWEKSLKEYLEFMEEALSFCPNYPVIPSCKYHLPPLGTEYKIEEYAYTTQKIYEVWKRQRKEELVLEKDFSATLAGEDAAGQKEQVLSWLLTVPQKIKESVEDPIYLGVKLMNTTLLDEFQREIVRELLGPRSNWLADYAVCFNRLFDPQKEFDGKVGVAYGGYDLSDRNLWALEALVPEKPSRMISATGNICSGHIMLEYALRGASNGQIHTFYQVPASEYAPIEGTRIQRALHELLFNPQKGLVAGLIYIRERLNKADEPFTFVEVTELDPRKLL